MKWVLCSIKNIAVPHERLLDMDEQDLEPFLHFVDTLPNNTIRVKRGLNEWCNKYCRECKEDDK